LLGLIAISFALLFASRPKPEPTPHTRTPWVPTPVVHAHLGSWGGVIKEPDLPEHDDVASTVEALIGTNQDFTIYHIDTDNDWSDFLVLLEEANKQGIRVYAAMNGPGTVNADCRWFGVHTDVPKNDCGDRATSLARWNCDQKFMGEWLKAWEAAATALSQLALRYCDTLVGFVINDFMDNVEDPALPTCIDGTKLTKDQIRGIYDACHSYSDHFGFYPAIQYPDLGRFISPGYVLGVNYGVRTSSDDDMAIRFAVSLPVDPIEARLTFFESEDADELHDEIMRSIRVQRGVAPIEEPWSKSLYEADAPYAGFESLPINLDAGANTIELRLSAYPDPSDPSDSDGCGNTVTSGCGTGFWHVWDATLEYSVKGSDHLITISVPLSTRSPAFETTADPDRYCIQTGCEGAWFDIWDEGGEGLGNDDCRCWVNESCYPYLPENETEGRLARRLVCAPNTEYLIEDVIDGIVVYQADTDTHGATDALDPNLHFARLVKATKKDLGDDRLICMQTALTDGKEFNLEMMARRIFIAAQEADCSGVYRFPLALYFMDPSDRRGVFAQSAVVTSEKGSLSGMSADFMAQWPTDQALLPGWYQRWVHASTTEAVEVKIEMWDDKDPASGDSDVLLKSVSGGGMKEAYGVDPFVDGMDSEYIPSDKTFLASSASAPVILQFHCAGDLPIYTRAYFRATDSSGGSISTADWTFESGIDDSHTIDVYNKLRDLFAIIRKP